MIKSGVFLGVFCLAVPKTGDAIEALFCETDLVVDFISGCGSSTAASS